MSGGRWPRSAVLLASRVWLNAVCLLVPRGRREEWLEEWEAELWQLWRRQEGGARVSRLVALPRYLMGAPLSALHEFQEEWMQDLWQDVRYAVRTLLRAPGFLIVAVLTLALGIGANTTVFTLINGLLLKEPAGIAQPDRLVRIGRGEAPTFDNWSYPVYQDLREQADWYSGVAAFASAGTAIIGRGQDASAVPAQVVSDNYFDVLGVRPVLGREFAPEENATPRAAAVAVISHGLWRTRFGGDPDVVGRTLAVNGTEFEVIGVAPSEFRGSDVFRAPADLWVPIMMAGPVMGSWAEERFTRRGSSSYWVFARLAPNTTFEQAAAATTSLYRAFDEQYPEVAGQGIQVTPGVGLTPADREATRRLSGLLLGIVLLVLLIACANLAGLGLARGAGRRMEVGLRAALGASRARVARQLLTESLLVSLAGGAAALGLTWLVAGRLGYFVPYSVSVAFEPDGRVLLFALATALLAALVFGLVPALSSTRTDLRSALTGGSRTRSGRGTRVRRGLVAAQLALSFVLLAGTGVLLRSLYNAHVVDPGFDADAAAVVTLDVDRRGGYDEARGRAFYRRLIEEVEAIPGVESVGLGAELPIADFQSNHTPLVEGVERDRSQPPPAPVLSSQAGAGYFEAMGIDLIAGRTFRESDYGENAEQVVVVNETLARRFFGERDPVGELLPFMADPVWEEPTRVIGVVAEHRNRALASAPAAGYWYPWERSYRGDMSLVVRAAGSDPGALIPRIAAAVQAVDPGMPILRRGTIRDLIGGTLQETRMLSTLIAIFGALALVLACIGLYGVMAYSVARRTREMGIRMALGARAGEVLRMVLRQGVALAVAGLALGVPLALAGLRFLDSALFGVSPADPLSLVAGGAVLLAVALIAVVVPARRATRVEPVRALREEA